MDVTLRHLDILYRELLDARGVQLG